MNIKIVLTNSRLFNCIDFLPTTPLNWFKSHWGLDLERSLHGNCRNAHNWGNTFSTCRNEANVPVWLWNVNVTRSLLTTSYCKNTKSRCKKQRQWQISFAVTKLSPLPAKSVIVTGRMNGTGSPNRPYWERGRGLKLKQSFWTSNTFNTQLILFCCLLCPETIP